MDWLDYHRQAVFQSVSNVISNAQTLDQYYRPWSSKNLSLKSLLQASLLAISSSEDRQEALSASCQNAQLSCHNTTAVDTCCLNYPGGLMLQTQFWDANPPVGPSDSWTIHGLWSVSYTQPLSGSLLLMFLS